MYHIFSRCIPQRYLVSVECLLCLTISYMMRFCLSMTITVMTEVYGAKEDVTSCPYLTNKTNNNHSNMEFHWSSKQQGLIHSAFFWGYYVTTIIGGVLSDLFNHKTIMLNGLLATCCITIATPFLTRTFDWLGLILCRIVVGLAQGVFYNSLLAVTAHWIPDVQRGVLGALVFSGTELGSSLNTILTGYIMKVSDWTVPFYVYSITGIVFAAFFFFTIQTDPVMVGQLSLRESRMFAEHPINVLHNKAHIPKSVPLKQIFQNIHLWVIVIASFCHSWYFFFLVTFLPTYFKSVLHLPTKSNAVYNSSMFLTAWIIALLSGYICDSLYRNNIISLTKIRKNVYLIGTILPALGLIGVSYSECHEMPVVMFMILGLSAEGLYYPTVKVNAMDLSPNFAGTIGSLAQMGSCTAGVLGPYAIGLITTNGSLEEWRIIFWISFGIMLMGGVIYYLFASAETQPFNEHIGE